ncbi:phosphotransferase [Catellatospora sp. NPDC049609]|uniref:phosphotransferase n=1 Tax=Catellatospora sp. NPDC049609 TaxID=3155505 RepID=UPI0034315ADB
MLTTVGQTPDTAIPAGDAQTLHGVAAHFQLGEIIEVREITEGVMNRNWQVTTDTGRYAVKQVLDVSADKARRQHEVTAALAAAGLPVPAPVTGGEGDTVWEIPAGAFAVLPWVAGAHQPCLQWSLEQCRRVGDLLAELHGALAGLLPGAEPAPAQVAEPAKAKAAIDRYLAIIGDLPVLEPFDALVRDRLQQRRDLLEQVAHLRPDETALVSPIGWVHGDFHDLNLLWGDGGQVAAVVDWDRLSQRPLAAEVVRSATLMFAHGDERGLDLDRVSAFVSGYTARRPLTPTELADAEHRLWWDRVCDLWQLKRHYDQGSSSCDHLFVSAAALLSWWTDHRADVAGALGAR